MMIMKGMSMKKKFSIKTKHELKEELCKNIKNLIKSS